MLDSIQSYMFHLQYIYTKIFISDLIYDVLPYIDFFIGEKYKKELNMFSIKKYIPIVIGIIIIFSRVPISTVIITGALIGTLAAIFKHQ